MQYTTNLNLKKPEYTDPADIQNINYNMDVIDEQLAEIVQQQIELETEIGEGTLDTTSQEIKGAINELEARPQKDIDNGRCQVEWGWDGTVYNAIDIDSNNVLSLGDISTSVLSLSMPSQVSSETNFNGMKFTAKVNATSVIVTFSTYYIQNIGATLQVRASDGNTVLASVNASSITGGDTIKIYVNLASNTNYYIGISGGTSTVAIGNAPTGYSNSEIAMLAGRRQSIDQSNIVLFSSIGLGKKQLLGYATKTYTPADIKKWGNVKWEQNTPANTSVVCDILSDSDVVLKSNVTSIADLSDIDTTQYSSLKTRWTLTRNSADDESPSISNPSWTWEGELDKIQFEDGAWERLSNLPNKQPITLTSDTAQVDIVIPTGYKQLRIRVKLKRTTTDGVLCMRYNDVSTAIYENKYTTQVGTTVTGCNPYNTTQIEFGTASVVTTIVTPIIIEIPIVEAGAYKDCMWTQSLSSVFYGWGKQTDNTTAITKINLFTKTGSLASGTEIDVWGCM